MKRLAFLAGRALALLAAALVLPSAQAAGPPEKARGYIVVLKQDGGSPAAAARSLGRAHGFESGLVYEHVLRGFSARLPEPALRALARHPAVERIEPDHEIRIAAQSVPTGIRRINAPTNPNIDIDGVDDWRVDADVAVMDTGVDAEHEDLNVVSSMDCTWSGSGKVKCTDGGADGHGHGTHVAGIVGAIDNGRGVVGVAPGARIWSLKVLRDDGTGDLSWLIAAMDWVTARAGTIRVVNLSLSCECSSWVLDQAVTRSVNAGVTYVVSAGNDARDVATYSPTRHPSVLAVSAIADFDGKAGGLAAPACGGDQDDTLADFSNFGAAVDIAAPGVCIRSTYPGDRYALMSGTSMAAPHVAGAAALLVAGGVTSPAAVRATLLGSGNFLWQDTSGDGHHEPLLNVGSASLYAPAMVSGTQPDSGSAPASVSILSPGNNTNYSFGTLIPFAAEADDGAGNDVSGQLQWTSSISGQIGTGASFSAQLAAGQHTITARLNDQDVSASIVITVVVIATCGGCHQ